MCGPLQEVYIGFMSGCYAIVENEENYMDTDMEALGPSKRVNTVRYLQKCCCNSGERSGKATGP